MRGGGEAGRRNESLKFWFLLYESSLSLYFAFACCCCTTAHYITIKLISLKRVRQAGDTKWKFSRCMPKWKCRVTGLRYKKHNNSPESLVADARDDEDAIINKEENFRCRASGSFQLKPEFSVLSQLFNWASFICILSGLSSLHSFRLCFFIGIGYDED